MATIPETQTDKHSHVGEQARQLVDTLRVNVAGSPMASLRVLVLLVVASVALSFAPQPWAAVGVGAMTVISLEWGRKK